MPFTVPARPPVRRLLPVAALLLVPVLAACGEDDPEETAATPTPSTPAASDPTSATVTESASTPVETEPVPVVPAACTLITGDDVAKAMGVAFEPAEQGGGATSEGDLDWQSDNCSFEAEDLVEVSVKLTFPDDFTKGDFTCPMPSDINGVVEPVDDVAGADQGWWKVSNPPNFAGNLRACTAEVLVEVELDYEDGVDYEGDPRQQAAQLAQLVLSNLQG
ncbi:hypothetical protein ACFQ0K_08110 [Nocardioides caeni]|uniref:DUF3558 domain-containing protein n=1 Tax=Nocardioides caeni TaxID=574700 RepID=A0A4S8N3H0_9ACTN|nr:hypothetical protein [Nocardioides caeni]THV10092.1 hypothetical protein E9934_14860 [Nocardioides caeni]